MNYNELSILDFLIFIFFIVLNIEPIYYWNVTCWIFGFEFVIQRSKILFDGMMKSLYSTIFWILFSHTRVNKAYRTGETLFYNIFLFVLYGILIIFPPNQIISGRLATGEGRGCHSQFHTTASLFAKFNKIYFWQLF